MSTALEISSKPLIKTRPYTIGLHCRGLPDGSVKWGACGSYVRLEDEPTQFEGLYAETTLNQGYLRASIEVLNKMRRSSRLTVVSTHDYLVKAMAAERHKWWGANDWIMTDGLPVKNAEMWKLLVVAVRRHALIRWTRPRTPIEQAILDQAARLSC